MKGITFPDQHIFPCNPSQTSSSNIFLDHFLGKLPLTIALLSSFTNYNYKNSIKINGIVKSVFCLHFFYLINNPDRFFPFWTSLTWAPIDLLGRNCKLTKMFIICSYMKIYVLTCFMKIPDNFPNYVFGKCQEQGCTVQ